MTSFLAFLISVSVTALPPHDPAKRIHDFANLLPPDVQQSLEELCQGVEKETTAQVAVVTVKSLGGKSIERYANDLFNEWGIGQKDTDNGVLLLVAPKDRKMRIEVGYGLEPILTDEFCGRIRDNHMLPLFRENRYADGIRVGTQAIVDRLRANPEEAKGIPGSGPILFRTPREDALWSIGLALAAAALLIPLGWWIASQRLYSTTAFFAISAAVVSLVVIAILLTIKVPGANKPWEWLGGGGAVAGGSLLYNWRRYRRYGPRGCSKCGAPLELLGEQEDDPKLTAVQRLEEKIGSVDYDVWFCPACLQSDTEQYIHYFSGFQVCDQCHARAFKEGPQKVVKKPTYSRSGLARVEGRCVNCNKKTVRKVTLPMLVQSTSSGFGSSSSGGSSSSFGGGSSSGGGGGGSSFGGGSSGGGGASGSW